MIIFGVQVKEGQAATETFLWPKCRMPKHYRRRSLHRWFSLYFIPIIPLGQIGEQAECQGCFSRYDARILWEAAAQAAGLQQGHGAVGTAIPSGQTGVGPRTTAMPQATDAEKPVHNPLPVPLWPIHPANLLLGAPADLLLGAPADLLLGVRGSGNRCTTHTLRNRP